MGVLSVVCVVLCLSTLLLICLPWLATVRRCRGALALFVWGTLYVIAVVFIFTGGPVTTWEQVRMCQKKNKIIGFIVAVYMSNSSSLRCSGGVFSLPVSERVHGAASLSALGPHGRDRNQRFTHHHHQRLRFHHQPGDTRPGCAGTVSHQK